jgi:predicted butyrate kinase (DUF1464 family)
MIEAVEGPLGSGLPLKSNFPEDAGDKLQAALNQIADQTRRQLAAIKLSDLMAGRVTVEKAPPANPDS